MFKKILLGIPLLCLSLQSTGYAAGTVVKELAEFGVPAARRAMSSFRQLAPLSTFQPPVPSHNLPAHTAKRYFSKVSDPVVDFHKVSRKSLDTRRTFSVSAHDGRDFFDLPLDEAIEAFLNNGNTEICAVDSGLAFMGTKVCNTIKNLKGYKDIGYSRDLDVFISSWTWKLTDLISLGKDLTSLERPIKKFTKVVRDFEKEVGISDAPYSSRVEAMIELVKRK